MRSAHLSPLTHTCCRGHTLSQLRQMRTAAFSPSLASTRTTRALTAGSPTATCKQSVDAVDIIVPPFLHHEMVTKAAAAGKHVYVEKPMVRRRALETIDSATRHPSSWPPAQDGGWVRSQARSLGECRAMISAADAAGTRLMVGESYFFSGPHVLAADLIKQGQIGEVQQVRINKAPWIFTPEEDERLDGGGHDPPWRFDPVLSGGGTLLHV